MTCADEKAAWQQADQALNQSVAARTQAAAKHDQAVAQVEAARNQLAAAEETERATTAEIEEANKQVTADSAAAADAYGEYLDCLNGIAATPAPAE